MLSAARNIARMDPPKPFHCVSGTSIFASPIEVEDQRVATIVVCSNPCQCFKNEPIDQIASETGLAGAEVQKLLSNEHKSPGNEQINATLQMLQSLATTLAQLSMRERQLRQRLNELTILHNLTSLLAGRSDLDQILKITARQVVQVVHGKGCSIRIYNPETQELHIKAVANLSDEYLRKGKLKLQDSPIDQSALEASPFILKTC